MYHCHDLGLHLSYTREHIRMNWVCDGKFTKGFCLQPNQFVPSMVDSAADATILPSCMLHTCEVVQLVANLFLAPSLAWQTGNALNAGTTWDEFTLKLENGFRNLCLHLCAHTWESQENTIEITANRKIEVA